MHGDEIPVASHLDDVQGEVNNSFTAVSAESVLETAIGGNLNHSGVRQSTEGEVSMRTDKPRGEGGI